MDGNDNYEDDGDFLLKKAQAIISKSKCGQEYAPCSLMLGGPCPLLNSGMESLKIALRK